MRVPCSLIATLTLLATAVFAVLLFAGVDSVPVVTGYVVVIVALQLGMDVLRTRKRIRERISAPSR